MSTKNLILLFISIILFTSCSDDIVKLKNNDIIKDTNKQIVLNALEKVFDNRDKSLINNYYANGYIQHNPNIADGKAGLIVALDNFIQNNITIKRDLARVISQNDKVFTHSRVRFIKDGNTINTIIVGDIFRIENGKIKEHWDVIQPEPTPNLSAINKNTMLDGLGNPDLQISPENLVRNTNTAKKIITAVLGNGELNLIPSLFQDPYIQHNPNIPNGTDALVNFLSKNGAINLEVKQIITEGNLVVTFNHLMSFNNANIDMFRLNDNGKAAEHWDIIQSIPIKADFAHGNGFF